MYKECMEFKQCLNELIYLKYPNPLKISNSSPNIQIHSKDRNPITQIPSKQTCAKTYTNLSMCFDVIQSRPFFPVSLNVKSAKLSFSLHQGQIHTILIKGSSTWAPTQSCLCKISRCSGEHLKSAPVHLDLKYVCEEILCDMVYTNPSSFDCI